MSDPNVLSAELARALFPARDPATFHPESDWADFGAVVEELEKRGLYLMVNSATKQGRVRRIAALHRDTGWGYPCVGSSEWGWFESVGGAVLAAAHEAVTKPRA